MIDSVVKVGRCRIRMSPGILPVFKPGLAIPQGFHLQGSRKVCKTTAAASRLADRQQRAREILGDSLRTDEHCMACDRHLGPVEPDDQLRLRPRIYLRVCLECFLKLERCAKRRRKN